VGSSFAKAAEIEVGNLQAFQNSETLPPQRKATAAEENPEILKSRQIPE
jgi:hypothetical protein